MPEEFISRTEAVKDFESCNAENPNWTPQRVKTLLLRQPAADVAEVRHGRWEQHLQSSRVAPVYTCSLCKLNVSGFEKRWIKYCPYCGARMEKEDEHEAD